MQKFILLKLLTVILLFTPYGGNAANPPKIVATIKPIHSIISAVTDGVSKPQLLIENNQSPHDYSLKPSDMKKLEDADIIFYVSKNIENFLQKKLDDLDKTKKIIELSTIDGLHLIQNNATNQASPDPESHNEYGDYDPHIWLNPQNAQNIAAYAEYILSELDPENKEKYAANASNFRKTLRKKTLYLSGQISRFKQKPFIVHHDAYKYFEDYFSLNSLAAITKSEEIQPSAKKIREINQIIADNNVKCIFAEPQFSKSIVESIAKTNKINIGLLDPIGYDVEAGKEAYLKILHNMTKNLTKCLADE